MQAVWEDEDRDGTQRTAFSSSSIGMDTSVWTADDARTQTFIEKLEGLELSFSVDDKQQVTTWLDSMFHK